MTPLHVHAIRDAAGLMAIKPEWDQLVERAEPSQPFLSHDWVWTWWECFGADKELCVLAVRAGGNLIALAPLMRTHVRMYGVPVWRLQFIANVHTPRFDLVVAERREEACVAILEYLHAYEMPWDILMLPELPGSSPTLGVLRRLAVTRLLRTGEWSAGASPVISLRGTFESYRASRSTKRRAGLRRRLRRLESLGTVSMEVTDADDLALALDDAFRIEAASWKGTAGTAIVHDEEVKRFYEAIAARACASKSIRLVFLNVGGKRIAFGYCLKAGGTLFLLKTGYDPAYATYSPFNVLMLFIIEDGFEDGLEAFDLLGCEDPWKLDWTEERTERCWLFLHRNTLRALAVYYLKFVLAPLVRKARAAAERTRAFEIGSEAA
jgi:CelD/BcsL family acetyltransferase involved in cellulose biosynthesis